MKSFLFKNGTIYTGEAILENHSIFVENGMIKKILQSDSDHPGLPVIDAGDSLVVPGFIDLQLNGGEGFFFTRDTNEDAVEKNF